MLLSLIIWRKTALNPASFQATLRFTCEARHVSAVRTERKTEQRHAWEGDMRGWWSSDLMFLLGYCFRHFRLRMFCMHSFAALETTSFLTSAVLASSLTERLESDSRFVCKNSRWDTSRMRTPSAASFLQSELDTELLQKLFETANLTKHGATSLLQASYEEAINSGAIEFAGENSAGIIFVLIAVSICIASMLVMCVCDNCCKGSSETYWSDPDDSFIQTGEVAEEAEGHKSKPAFLGGRG